MAINIVNVFAYFTDKDSLSNKLSIKAEYTIIFNANTGIGTMENQEISYNVGTKLSKNLFTKEEYAFNGWNTKEDGTGTSYEDEEVVTNIHDTTLYAQWKKITGGYNVIFYKNNDAATGTMPPQEFGPDEEKKLSANTFTLEDYEFIGWNTKEDGTGESYTNEMLVSNLSQGEDVKLYAQWNRIKYTNNNSVIFDGTNYINTDMRLFSEINKNRDFIAEFTIQGIEDEQEKQAVIFGCINEGGSPWPGINYRVRGQGQNTLCANASTTEKIEYHHSSNNITKVTIKKINNIIYLQLNDGENKRMVDMSKLGHTIDIPVTFGTSLNANGEPQRQFTGTLSNMKIMIY